MRTAALCSTDSKAMLFLQDALQRVHVLEAMRRQLTADADSAKQQV